MTSGIFIRDARLASPLARLTALLLLAWGAASLALGARWLDGSDPEGLVFMAQDVVGVAFGLPFLVLSAWSARRGSIRGLLCWAGALLYLAYFWIFHVAGGAFDPLLPAHIVIVSLGMYGALYPLVGLDPEAIKARFALRFEVRTIAMVVMGTSAIVTVAWLVLIVSRANAGVALDNTMRLLVALDGVVLLPLIGGLWLWRKQPLGYPLVAILLVKGVATFLTLAVTSLVAWTAGGERLLFELAVYAAGLGLAALLLFTCLACLEEKS